MDPPWGGSVSDVFKKIRYQVALLNAACFGGKLNTVTYCVERIQQQPNSWLTPECLTPFLDAACQGVVCLLIKTVT